MKTQKNKFKKITLSKHFQIYLILILFLFSMYLSFNLRNQSSHLQITQQWAEQTISSNIKSQIYSQVDKDNPYLPEPRKQKIVEEQFKQYSQNNEEYKKQILLLSQQFKSRLQDEKGCTYLLAIDPYYYYLRTKLLLETGHTWTRKENGTFYDGYMLAPKGVKINPHFSGAGFHEWFSASIYKITKLFNPETELMHIFFFIPIIVSLLAIIPAFFIVKEMGGGIIGAFLSSVLVAIHPNFLTRTAGGFSDTDAYNVMFPLFTIWMFILGFKSKRTNQKIIFGLLSGILIGLFSFAWVGWWYIFDILLATLVIYFILKLIEDRKHFWKQQKTNLLFSGIFIFVSGIFVSIFRSVSSFFNFIKSPLSFLLLKESVKSTLWPNVFTTVAELNNISMKTVISNIGGWVFLVFSLIVPIILVLFWLKNIFKHTKNTNKITIFFPLISLVWVFVTLFTTTRGVRFTLFVVPAIAVSFGYSMGIIINKLSNYSQKEWKINPKISSLVLLLLVLFLFIVPKYSEAKKVALTEIPSMNDAWYNTLTKIKYETNTTAIINSWWDFGHQFKAIADRRVTFDGGSQNTPQAHWIGRVLLTKDEDEAIGILRMLDCSANDAFDEINSLMNDTPTTISLLRKVQLMNKNEAHHFYEEKFGKEEANKLINLTHCINIPDNYFITSGDMVGKAGVWAHFGSWNFEKAEISQYIKNKPKQQAIELMVDKYGKTYQEAEVVYNQLKIYDSSQINNWVSPWPNYYGKGNCALKEGQNNMSCVLNIQGNRLNAVFDMQKTDFVITTSIGELHPYSVVYESLNGVSERKYEQTAQEKQTIPFSVAIYQDEQGQIKNVVMSPELSTSLFTKLFYYEGKGLNHFELFDKQTQLTGEKIYVWKVNWE